MLRAEILSDKPRRYNFHSQGIRNVIRAVKRTSHTDKKAFTLFDKRNEELTYLNDGNKTWVSCVCQVQPTYNGCDTWRLKYVTGTSRVISHKKALFADLLGYLKKRQNYMMLTKRRLRCRLAQSFFVWIWMSHRRLPCLQPSTMKRRPWWDIDQQRARRATPYHIDTFCLLFGVLGL